MIQPQHQAEAAPHGRADQPLPRGGSYGREFLQWHGMRSRAWPRADENIQMEIFERGVKHFLHIGQQAVNFVDEENTPRLDGAEQAGQIQLFLHHGAGSLREWHFEFLRNDGRKRGLAKAGRTIEQHVVHRLTAFAGGFNGDLQILFEARLSGKVRQAARTQTRFELKFVFR